LAGRRPSVRRQRFATRALRPFAGVCLGLFAAGAHAQQDAPPVVTLDKVEVTGSNLKRIDGETGLPVQVITREQLLDGGVQTMQELVARISAAQSFGSSNETLGIGSPVVGFTSASLRGLGSQRTLILLNGRRLAPYALSGGQSVDLSGIPSSAIERVEVLKDGASAIYGADAIGGVINFILRKDYAGVEVGGNVYATEQGGGNNGRVNATLGTGSLARDGYNLFVTVDHFRQQALAASQRDSTKTGYIPEIGVNLTSMQAFPANIRQNGGFAGLRNPTIPVPGSAPPDACAPPTSFVIPNFPALCIYDATSQIDAIPEAEKTNVIARFTRQLGPDHQFFAEAAYYRGSVTQRIAPAAVAPFFTSSPIVLPPTSPHYPTSFVTDQPGGDPSLPLALFYRTVELGKRIDRVDVDQWNAVVGLQGVVKGWDYGLVGTYTANRQRDYYLSGMLLESRFAPLMGSGVVNPFGPNTPEVVAMLRDTQATGQANDNRASNVGASLKVAGDAWRLPAGPLAVAFGLEARREQLEQTNADFISSGDVLGGIGAVPSLASSSRTVWSAFAEADVPIVRTLDANLAVRHDHYSDFGGTTNPKLTVRWQPTKALLARASYGSGFRAPTLSDLFQPPSIFRVDDFQDPIRCPVTGADEDCSVPLKVGGNPSLRPETSRQLNVGIVLEPAAGLSASLDYYRVTVRNVIDVVSADAIFQDYALWAPGYVVRKPPDPQSPELPGPIDYVVQYATNVGTLKTSGLDVSLQWRGPATAYGRFAATLEGSYVVDYEHTGFASSAAPTAVGTRGFAGIGAISRWRHYAQLQWTYGAWGATLANTYQSGYAEIDLLSCDENFTCGTRRVEDYSTWDLQVRYTGIANATVALGVLNLLDRAPPLTNQFGAFQIGIDPTYADPRGRTWYATLRYAFR